MSRQSSWPVNKPTVSVGQDVTVLQDWQSFYQVTGSASGAIIGLLFIVATLTSSTPESGVTQGVKLFTTPTVVHLALVLALSALALVPPHEAVLAKSAALACAGGGFTYATVVAVQLQRLPKHTHWSDVWFYGAAPMAVYLGLVLAVVATCAGRAHAGLALALTLLVLLMLAIRNAWDLVTWLAPRRTNG